MRNSATETQRRRGRLKFLFFLCVSVPLWLMCGCGKENVSIGRDQPETEIKKCTALIDKKKFEQAIQCLEMFKARFANTAIAQEAELAIGDTYYNKKDYLLAAESYLAFIKLYPTHPRRDYAHYRAGSSYFKESPEAIDRDQEYLEKAIEQLSIVVRRYTSSPYAELAAKELIEALNRVARRHFYVGRFYFRTGEYMACLPRFEEIVQSYPKSGLADRSLYMLTVANLKLKRTDDARLAFSRLSVEYPTSKWTKKAEGEMRAAAK